MSVSLGANGNDYAYPQTDDTVWGDAATNWASAISAAMSKLGLGSTLTASAVMDIVSTTKGILPPRMTTTQRDAIVSPATGLVLYNTTTSAINYYNGSGWIAAITSASISDSPTWAETTVAPSARAADARIDSKVAAVIDNSPTWNETTQAPSALAVENRFLQISASPAPTKGFIGGFLAFNSTSLPATIKSGAYEVNGTMVSLTADATLAWTDVFGSSRQALDTYGWYLVCMNSSGTKKVIRYGEGLVSGATGTVTSITEGGAGLYTLTKNTGTLADPTSKTLIITDGSTVVYAGKATGGNGTTTATFTAPAGITFSTAGTWSVYDRINTLHGTGSATAITTDANIEKYTPSLGENGWSAGIVAWSDSLQGYYLTLTGLTGYRVLGAFNVGAANVSTNVIGYKTGRDKNDNYSSVSRVSSQSSDAIVWTNVLKMNGCDYIYYNANPYYWKAMRSAKVDATYMAYVSGNFSMGILNSPTDTSTYLASSDYQRGSRNVSADFINTFSISDIVNVSDFTKPLLSGTADTTDAANKFSIRYTL
jgi:hypothetical protein